MKRMKKWFSVFLIVVFTMTLIPTTVLAANSIITRVQVIQKLKAAESKWVNGTTYVDRMDDECYTCFGFGRELFAYLYDASAPNRWSRVDGRFDLNTQNVELVAHLKKGFTLEELKELLKQAQAGDILIVVKSKTNHMGIIRSVNSDGSLAYVYDANYDRKNTIRTNGGWSAQTIYTQAKNYAVALYKYKYMVDANMYTVTFDSNGGAVSELNRTVTEGSVYGTLPTPTREGYIFKGWRTDKSGNGMRVSANATVLAKDHTLYATWEKAPYEIINEGTYTLTPKNAPKMRLDISGASTKDGANVQIYTANNTAAQQFKFKHVANGYYTIQSVASGKVLDIKSKSTASGANVQQWSAVSGATNQQWMLKDAGDGYYYIVPGNNSSLCLDVKGAGTSNGTNVQVYTANQSNAQKWKLVKAVNTPSSDKTVISTGNKGVSGLITPPATKVIVNTTNVLKNGYKGTQVRYLQMNLNMMNYSCGSADGNYGNNTKNAVLQFQKDNGLTQDGIAGPATLEKMVDIAVEVQTNLYKLGFYKGNIDGVMGSDTKEAIIKYQKANNYYESGLATKAVQNALNKSVGK